MSRALGVCLIFLWITAAAKATYVLSNETALWEDAKNTGNFATPTIQINTNNILIIVNTTSDLNVNEKAWVGYYKKETAFAYIGCSHLNNIETKNVWLLIANNTPGMCLSMCNRFHKKYMYIGLKKKKCFCLSKIPSENIHLPNCTKTYNGNWIAGRGAGYMSIYQKMETDINGINNQDNGSCLAFEKTTLLWSRCQLPYHASCIKDTTLVNATYHQTQNYYEWKYYVQRCFKIEYSPLTFNDITSPLLQTTTGQIWTNVIRSDVIYKYHECSNSISKSSVEKHGYVTKSGNMTILSFTSNSTEKLYFLQTRTSTHTTSSSTTPVSQKMCIPPMNDGSMNSTEGFQSKNKKSTSDRANVSIPVSVSVVAIIFVAVVLVIILKRRWKFQGICAKNSALENLSSKRNADKVQAENNVYKESPVDDYEQISDLKDNNNEDVKPDIGVENGNYGHTYFILEPGSRETHTDGDMSDSRNNETEMNDDYNTLHLNKTFAAKADDTYDTTEKAAIKLKTLHDTGCEKESPEKLNGNEEDTYNHISRNLLKNNKTDNIYGVTDNQEDDYGDVHNGCEKNRHNGDDTYSHLNTTH